MGTCHNSLRRGRVRRILGGITWFFLFVAKRVQTNQGVLWQYESQLSFSNVIMLLTCHVYMYILQLIQSSMSMAHLPRPAPSISDTEPLSTHWKIWFLNLSVQKSNSYLLKCLKNTLPASEVWTHVFQQPTLLTVSPWIDDKLPWIFLRAFRLSVRLQAKTEGQPLLGKLRLICTTPTQLVHLIMTWLQNKTIQQCLTIF